LFVGGIFQLTQEACVPKKIWKDKALLLFLFVTFTAGIGLQLMSFQSANKAWPVLAMWTPTLALLLMRRPGLVALSNL
jgi:hypothetical protein